MTSLSNNSQMYNDIMAVGSKERPPMLAMVLANRDNQGQPQQVSEEIYTNTTPKNRNLIDAKAKTIHMILNGIGDNIYSTVDACSSAKEIWESIERLQQGESINKHNVKIKLF
ncbi:hypothetical protein Tco_0928636 [Tanacetum coccineum]